MNQTKKWYQSATIWGIVFSALAFIVGQFTGVQAADIPVPANPDFEQLKQIANEVIAAKGNIIRIVSIIIGSIGAVIAIYNRVVAKAKIVAGKTTT